VIQVPGLVTYQFTKTSRLMSELKTKMSIFQRSSRVGEVCVIHLAALRMDNSTY
jgi:hypothetical protein